MEENPFERYMRQGQELATALEVKRARDLRWRIAGLVLAVSVVALAFFAGALILERAYERVDVVCQEGC